MLIDPLPKALTANEKRVKALLDQGMTMFQIAYKLHISFEQTREIIFEIRKKEAISMARRALSEEQRAEVVKMYAGGASASEIAGKYFVSKSGVMNILHEAGVQLRPKGRQKNVQSTGINEDFEQAVDAMIAERDAADAEQKSAIAEPEKLPDVIWHACDDKISMINLDIETRKQRIAELKEEIEQLCAEREQIRAWMEGHS